VGWHDTDVSSTGLVVTLGAFLDAGGMLLVTVSGGYGLSESGECGSGGKYGSLEKCGSSGAGVFCSGGVVFLPDGALDSRRQVKNKISNNNKNTYWWNYETQALCALAVRLLSELLGCTSA
jgi:hypothetical protein